MAYVFDPINNTLIDDEDKSLGNKFAVLDPDLEKVLQELNEKFGPGTIQEGTEGIPQPPIKTPQAIFEFEERMKGRMADGGKIGGGIITGKDYGDRTGFAKILRSPTGQNLSIENYPKNLLEIIDNHLKGKSNIILKYATDEVNKLLEPYDVKLGEAALRKRISQLNLDDKILRGKIKGVKYKPKALTEKNLIVEDFVEETNKKILEGYQNKKLGKVYDVDLGTDLAKKLGKDTTPKQALSVLRNHQKKSETKKLLDVDAVRMRIGNELVEKYNDGVVFVKKDIVLQEAGYPKGSPYRLNKLESRKDKIIKATEILFRDPATKAVDLFNPYQKIAKLIDPSERKGKRGEVERIRVDDISKVVNKNFPDLESTIKKLSNANFKQKILNDVKKGQVITLEDIETGLRKGTGLPFGRNIYTRMVMHAARHQDQAAPGKSLTQFYDKNGKIITNLNDLDSYSNVTFKYRPNTSVDFNKIKEVYGVSRGLVEIPEGTRFVDLTFEAEKLPQFKEYFSKVEEIENLKRRDVIHPVTKKQIKFSVLMGEAYQKGSGYTKSYERFPYDIDHKFGVGKDPFKNLSVIPQRLNVGGGQAKFRGNEKALKKMGYTFDKDIEKLFQDEVKLAEKILVKGRKLKSAIEATKPVDTEGTSFKSMATSLKDKLDKSRMFTSRIPGGAVALTPLDFTLSMASGLPLTESLASAGSYLIKDPYLGKAVNIPLAIAADIQDPEGMMERAGTRQEKFKNILEGITGIDQDKPLLDELREKFSNMEAGDQPDIDPFQAAEGGRAGFSNGGAAGADDNFLKELEFYFTNEDAELPKLQTYKETMNPVEVLNDIIDPRNYPYYADVLARSGLRIGEFAVRVLPATGKLISDAIQKGPFKVTGTGSNYVQDYTDVVPSNIEGTGIFSEFLKNITPTATEKFVGLDKLIEKEEQKQIERGSTVGPKVFADTIGLGAEVTAPIFPGLKLLRAYAARNNLPIDTTTQKILVKEIDKTLEDRGMTRREFLQATGAGATIILAKMLGLGDDVAKTAKVAEKVAAPTGAPQYFFDLVDIIKTKGRDTTKRFAFQDLQNVFSYKGYDLYEDLTTGEIRIEKTNTGIIRTADDVEEGIASQDVLEYKPSRTDADPETKKTITDPEEYNEGSVFPDSEGKMKEVEDLDIEELLEFIKNEKAN